VKELASALADRKRGVYRKSHLRESSKNAPAAWTIGDPKSFRAARARVQRDVGGDIALGRKQVAALLVILDHMNCGERWSCFASIPKMAKEAGVHEATVWRAIEQADGKYILTMRGRRPRSRGPVTHITIHPDYAGNPRIGARVNDENPRTAAMNTLAPVRTEPSLRNLHRTEGGKNGGRERGDTGKPRDSFVEVGTPEWSVVSGSSLASNRTQGAFDYSTGWNQFCLGRGFLWGTGQAHQ
jgi:hypothetical protein